MSGRHGEERAGVDVTFEAETVSTPTPPAARGLVAVEVVRRQTLGVVAARPCAFQCGHSYRHDRPLRHRPPQVCTRLSIVGRSLSWMFIGSSSSAHSLFGVEEIELVCHRFAASSISQRGLGLVRRWYLGGDVHGYWWRFTRCLGSAVIVSGIQVGNIGQFGTEQLFQCPTGYPQNMAKVNHRQT